MGKNGRQKAPTNQGRAGNNVVAPRWLQLAEIDDGDRSLTATASWIPVGVDDDVASLHVSLQLAWQAWTVQDWRTCRGRVKSCLDSLGTSWLPAASIDGKRCWTWLRLVSLLPEALDGDRRAAVGCIELLHDLHMDHTAVVLDDLLDVVLQDFTVHGSARREWGALAGRLCLILGHEAALEMLESSEKAELRVLWRTAFGAAIDQASRTTVDFVEDLQRDLKSTLATLGQVGTPTLPGRRELTSGLGNLAIYLDDEEQRLVSDASSVLTEALELVERPTLSTALTETVEACAEQASEVMASRSVLVQNVLGPLLYRAQGAVEAIRRQFSDASHPELRVLLNTDKLPLSASNSEVIDVKLGLANRGNVEAHQIEVALECESILFLDARAVARLAPGGEVELSFEGLVAETGRTELVIVRLTCVDALRQSFEFSFDLLIEDQRPSTWTDYDRNPFTLSVVRDPSDLIGRDPDVKTLQATIASGSSMSVTGQKRVGKSSIVRTTFKSAEDNLGWLTAYLPLGRAVTTGAQPADFVLALLRNIAKVVRRGLPGVRQPDLNEEVILQRFAVEAGEWISDLSDEIPASTRLVVAIDDFDELPPQLREGPEADSLFNFLRSLIDEPWLSLVFVGSEILPTIIAGQAHKLNQVVPLTVRGFQERAQTQEMLEQLSGDRIDWDESAVDLVHHLSAGVPYYSRQIASEVWNALKQRERAYAQRSDVEAAVGVLAGEAPIVHYMHLWADDLQGMALRERRSVVASAVLRAASHCVGSELKTARIDEVLQVAQGWMQSATLVELRQTLERLISRGVLRPGANPDTVEVTIGLVARWLVGSGGREIESYYTDFYHSSARATIVTDRELIDLSDGLVYCGERVSEYRLRAWLDQFDGAENRRFAFLLARRLIEEGLVKPANFAEQATALRKKIMLGEAGRHQELDKFKRLKNFYLIEHGESASSSQAMLSDFAKQFKIVKANVMSPRRFADVIETAAPNSTKIALVLDDFAGTGNQLSSAADGFIASLDQQQELVWRDRVIVVAGSALSACDWSWEPGARNLDGQLDKFGNPAVGYSAHGQLVPNRLHAFHPAAEIFEGEEERSRAMDLMKTIGGALVRNAPLGYGDQGLLVSMANNCPNNTLPIFWKRGNFAGKSWLPLLERRV